MKTLKEDALREILAVAAKLGKDRISRDEYEKHKTSICSVTLRKLFGSVSAAFLAAGLRARHVGNNGDIKITKEMVLTAIKETAKSFGRNWITRDEFSKNSGYSTTVLYSRFGSAKKAFLAAGLEIAPPPQAVSESELIADVKRVSEALNRTDISANEYSKHGRHGLTTLIAKLGSFDKVSESLGFSKKKLGKIQYSKEMLLAILNRFNKEFGRPPTVGDLVGLAGYPSHKTFYLWFPGLAWIEILEKAGLKSKNQHFGLDLKYYASTAERDIADLFYKNYIPYEPHKRLCEHRKWECDFYLPQLNLWIEYDGLEERRKEIEKYEEKLAFYKKYQFNYIQCFRYDNIIKKCGLYIDSSNLELKQITYQIADEFLRCVHYLKGAAKGDKHYGGFVGEKLVGVISVGQTSNPHENFPAINRIAYLDIVRNDKNFGSRFIAMVLKEIKKSGYSGKIVSWSDPRYHQGGLYKAANFKKIVTKKRYDYGYLDTDGNEYHKSKCRVPAGESEAEYAKSLGLIKTPIPPKQRWEIEI